MKLRHRHRRWIALLALFALLFQHAAMAAYRCPLELEAARAAIDAAPPCHEAQDTPADRSRCHAHCHPATSVEQPPPLTVPPAAILVTATIAFVEPAVRACAEHLDAPALHAGAPPLRTRYCTLLI